MSIRFWHVVFTAIFSLAVTSWNAEAQVSPGGQVPANQRTSSTGTIRGRITEANGGRPLSRVRISLTPAVTGPGDALGRGVGASTNAQGQFEVKDVPPGLYRVSAARAGYVTIQYGQRRMRESGQTVEVKSGETVTGIDIALPKGGVLAGRITDELGAPYAGVQVTALDLRYVLGSSRRVGLPVGGARTDDRGQFRISGLAPGSYYVEASSPERWMGPDKQPFGYVRTYFPGVRGDVAQAIPLTAAQQRTDIEIRLLSSRTVRVTGRAQSENGEALVAELVNLSQKSDIGISGTPTGSVRTGRDGAFEIIDVPSGEYRLGVTRRSANGQTELAALNVSVGDAPIEGLLLVPRGGSNMRGTVVTDEGKALPFPAARLQVRLTPRDNDQELSGTRSFPVTGDGSVLMTALRGSWLFRLGGLPDGWMVKAVRLEDEDITEVPFDVPIGGREIGGFQIVITQKAGSVSGNITDATGKAAADASVVIFPDDVKLWVPASRFVRAFRPDGSGHFAISGLPPGKYHAAVRDFVEDGQEADREFLDTLRRDALSFELSEGESRTLALKLQPTK